MSFIAGAISAWGPQAEDLIEGSEGITWFNRRVPQTIEVKAPICDVIEDVSPIADVLEVDTPIADQIEGKAPIMDILEVDTPIADVYLLKRPFK